MLAKKNEEFALYEEQPILKPSAVKTAKINKKLRIECFILVLVISVLAMFTTFRSEVMVSDGYALVQMKSEALRLEKENERLKLEIAQMKSPQRIKEAAIANLGMVMPEEVYFATKQGE